MEEKEIKKPTTTKTEKPTATKTEEKSVEKPKENKKQCKICNPTQEEEIQNKIKKLITLAEGNYWFKDKKSEKLYKFNINDKLTVVALAQILDTLYYNLQISESLYKSMPKEGRRFFIPINNGEQE